MKQRIYFLTVAAVAVTACLLGLSKTEAGKPDKDKGGNTTAYTVFDLHPGPSYFESTATDVSDEG